MTENVTIKEDGFWDSLVRTFNLQCSIGHDDSIEGPMLFTAAPNQILELVLPACDGYKNYGTGGDASSCPRIADS
jgi:hypothetical protein